MAVLLTTGTFLAVLQATQNLFGSKARFWTGLTLAMDGPFIAVARLGVYDVLALAGIGASLWAITQLPRKDHRGWLVLGAVLFALGVLGEYPAVLMLIPMGFLLLALRGEHGSLDLGIFVLIIGAVALAYFLPLRDQLSELADWYASNTPTFGETPPMTRYRVLYWSGAPFALALCGWFVARGKRRLATVLLLSLLIWPVYHLHAGHATSMSKHLVLGFLMAYPLIGLGLSSLWGERGRRQLVARFAVMVLVLILAVLGAVQVYQFNRAWPDEREAAAYLVANVQPGQKLLASDSWPYVLYLYSEGRIDSPWDVFDAFRTAQGESSIPLCSYDWVISSLGISGWPPRVIETLTQCRAFRAVFYSGETFMGLNSRLKYASYPVVIDVWQSASAQAQR